MKYNNLIKKLLTKDMKNPIKNPIGNILYYLYLLPKKHNIIPTIKHKGAIKYL